MIDVMLSAFSCCILSFADYGDYGRIGVLQRTNSLTGTQRPTVAKKTMLIGDDASAATDKMALYAIVRRSTRKKSATLDAKVTPNPGECSQLYSKVAKSKKMAGDGERPGRNAVSVQPSRVAEVNVATEFAETPEVATDTGYELIQYKPKVTDYGYNSVPVDNGYESVDLPTEKGLKDCMPSLSMLSRAAEHIYDVVPENLSSLTDATGTGDYDEIPAEKV